MTKRKRFGSCGYSNTATLWNYTDTICGECKKPKRDPERPWDPMVRGAVYF
ncbi:hypothetical protein ACHAPJ_009287 [Fusarium lateritium]